MNASIPGTAPSPPHVESQPGISPPPRVERAPAATDAELVARCRAGEDRAWEELVERFSRYVHAIATRVYRLPSAEAEDVFQDTFARLYESLDGLRDDAAVKGWIAQVARRLSIDKLRSMARERPTEDGEDLPAADEQIERLDEALAVHAALATLPAHSREILDRFFARDESYRTIAEALGIPQGTIASRISRSLEKLRVELERVGGENPYDGGTRCIDP